MSKTGVAPTHAGAHQKPGLDGAGKEVLLRSQVSSMIDSSTWANKAPLELFLRDWAGARVGVVYGPMSVEDRVFVEYAPHAVSLTPVVDSVRRLGFVPVPIDPNREKFIDDLRTVDIAFVNMHGEFGEDGRLQGLLDYLGVPYTGSGVLAGALGLHKVMFKRVLNAAGIPTPRSISWGPYDSREAHTIPLADIKLPLMAKRVSGGSSLGMRLITDARVLQKFVSEHASESDSISKMYVEEYLLGRSVTVAVIEIGPDLVSSPPLEARFGGQFYDASAKMGDVHGDPDAYQIPDFPQAVLQEVREAALRVHKILECRGFSRVDFVVQPDGEWHVLEINTIPGMTPTGNFVTCLAHLGLTYDEVVVAMLQAAVKSVNKPPGR